MRRHYIELMLYKSYADLRLEAARSYLGFLWWILEPLLYMVAFYVLFGLLLQRGGEGFIFFLLCGLVTYRWFDNTVRRGIEAIPSNAGLMWQVYLPKFVFPGIVIFSNAARFLVVLTLLLAFLLLFGPAPSQTWVALPVLLGVQLVVITACTLFVSAIVPFLPDLRQLLTNGMTLLFFMSGIFYDIRGFPEQAQFYFYLNPMATLIENYRIVLLEGSWPNWSSLLLVALCALPLVWLAFRLLVRFDRVYPKVLIS